MTESSGKCPRCGKRDWWQVFKSLSKSGKRYYELAQCSSCLFVHRYGYAVHVGDLSKVKKLVKRQNLASETKQD